MRCSCTAGACAMIDQKSRALGSDSSCLASKMVAVLVDVTSTTGDAPLIVTVSWSEATLSSTFTVAVKPTPTLMPSRITPPNPPSSYCTRYPPGGTPGSRYVPSTPVTVVRAPCSAGLVAVTVTPGSTAPLESVTLPVSDPLVAPTVCACTRPAAKIDRIPTTPHTTIRLLRMTLSLMPSAGPTARDSPHTTRRCGEKAQ